MSKVQIDTYTDQSGKGAPNLPHGAVISGVLTATSVNQTVNGNVTVSGNVGISGTITYEDATDIDSVGIVTARSGVKVGAHAGVGLTIFSDGSINSSGIITASNISVASSVTAATFHGSGANLTSLPASGLFSSYALIEDQKGAGANGGTFTSGAWRTRDLNTEIFDPDSIVSISSNQFTLQAGSYFLRGSAPAYRVDQHFAKLQNITDATLTITGSVSMGSSSFASTTVSLLAGRFTISAAKVFEIQHRCITTHSSHGFGINHNIGGFNSIYTLIEIFKES